MKDVKVTLRNSRTITYPSIDEVWYDFESMDSGELTVYAVQSPFIDHYPTKRIHAIYATGEWVSAEYVTKEEK